MAAKLIVALACFALCNSSPVFLKGYLFRDGRGYSIGQGYTNNPNGRATGSATINGGVIRAYGSASDDGQDQSGRTGYGLAYPAETVAKAEVYDTPNAPVYGTAKAEAQNTPTYYAIPAPATIVSYEQNFEVPAEISYEFPGTVAHSSAVLNGDSESITSAKANGPGVAESSANTQGIGTYGITSSNAKTFGLGSANSNAKNSYGTVNTATQSQGYGAASSKSQNGLGLTSANSQTNGGYASSSANNALDSVVASANSQGYGSASSKADSNNLQGIDVNSAKTNDFKGIHWRFGTAYTVPTPGQVHASSQSYGGSAKSTAQTNGAGYGNAITTADTQGHGSASSNANLNGGYINSVSNTNGLGYGAAKSTINNGYETAKTVINNGYGNVKSTANSNGYGNANAQADIDQNGKIASVANSNGYGAASSSANSGPTFTSLRSDGVQTYSGSRTSVNAHTSGQGSASSSATQGLNTGYRVVNSVANTSGYGTAQANASA